MITKYGDEMRNIDKNTPETVVLSDSAIGHTDKDNLNPYLYKIPFTITNLKTGREWSDIPNMDYYDELDLFEDLKTPGLLGTSQPNESEYVNIYQEIFSNGAKRIVVVPMSQALSGSFNSATLAADKINQEFTEDRPRVIVANSLTVSIPQRLQVEKAIETIKLMESQDESDQAAEEAIVEIENIRSKIHVAELFPSLQHIVMGGRGSEAIKKIFGGKATKTLEKFGFSALLGLSTEGKLVPVVRNPLNLKGREKVKRVAIESLIKRVGCDVVKLSIVKFGVEKDEIDDFRAQILNAFENENITINGDINDEEQSKTLDVHSGFKALGAVVLEQC